MKQKLKNYIKLGILLFGILFLVTNCENEPIKEIHTITKPSFTTSKINLSSFKNKDKVFKKLNDVSKNTTNLQNRTVYDSINNLFVNTESVILIEYEEYHWLTFNIERDYETNLLENLILKYNVEHDTYQAFISEYDITDEERELLSQGSFIPNLELKTTFYPLVEFNNNILNRPGDIIEDPITGNCYMVDDVIIYTDGTFVVTYIQVDCPGGAGNNSNNNGDGNGSGTETGNDTGNDTGTNNSNNDGDSTQNGGGGSNLDNTVVTTPNTISELCKKINQQVNNPNYNQKAEILLNSLGLNHEVGFIQSTNGPFTQLSLGSDNHTLYLPDPLPSDLVGYMHSHNNDYEVPDRDGDGNPETIRTIKMLSDNDIRNFIRMLINARENNISASEVYGTMYSSYGNYTLRFIGDVYTVQNNYQTPIQKNELRKELIKYFDLYNNKEKAFLHFLKDVIGIDGIKLFKIKNNGTIEEKKLNEDGRVSTFNC